MKNYILLSVILFSSLQIKSQSSVNVVPPSPQANEFVKYGNQELNEYRGMARVSIPITDIKDKKLYNNINLVYSKLGVKVGEQSNNVGISWLLDAGGIITRTINDLPDEMQLASDRLVYNSISELSSIFSTSDNSNNPALLNSYFVNETYDNELDIFSISVNGISGRFYLDKNLNPILLTQNHQFKVETVGDFKTTHELLLTTVDGVKYYFGGAGATEKTWKREAPIYSGITSFYLTKISNYEGEEINFSYSNLGAKSFLVSKYETKFIQGSQMSQHECYSENSHAPGDINTNNLLKLADAKQLYSITSRDKKVIFNHLNTNNTLNEKLSSIDVLNQADKKIQKIEFKYLDQFSMNPSILQRFFLTKVKIYNYIDENLVFDKEYVLSYDEPLELPNRDSYNVDVFGYFNGKSNTSFLPDLDLLNGKNNFPSNFIKGNLADRRSDFEKAKKGTLTSIVYPTKGRTIFEYEGLPQKFPTYAPAITGEVRNSPYDLPVTQYSSGILDGKDVLDNKIEVNLSIYQYEHDSYTTMLEVKFKILDVTSGSNEVFNKSVTLPNSGPNSEPYRTDSVDFTFDTEKNKKYQFVITLVPRANVNYSGDFRVEYKNGYGKQNIAGLRLKSLYDIDENNNITNYKRLYYSSYKDIGNNEILPDSYYYKDYKATTYFGTACQSPYVYDDGDYYRTYKNISLQSEPLTYYSNDEFETPFNYPIVTLSYGGENFEKGGEEKRFVNNHFDVTSIFKQPQSNYFLGSEQDLGEISLTILKRIRQADFYDDFNGRIYESSIIKNKEGQLFVDSRTLNSYDLQLSGAVYDLSGTPAFTPLYPNIPIENIVSNLFIYSLTKNIYSVFSKISKNIKYIDDVPVNTIDDAIYKKLTTTTEYFYNNPAHYQLTTQKTTFPDGSYQTTDYGYASEKSNTYLQSKNMVGIPLITQTSKTVNGVTKTVSKSETVYPDSVQQAKERIINNVDNKDYPLPRNVLNYNIDNLSSYSLDLNYDFYDNKGNILQYTTKDGISTAIIWGYNQTQPIAKIEGAKYSDVSGYISTIVSKSDADGSSGTANSEQQLLDELDLFRNKPELSAFQITTYTYDPLIGVRSITPPNGVRQIYIYDTSNRLKEVREQSETGNLLKEYQYNYKH